MRSERECFVYIVLPGATEFVTAGRFRWTEIDEEFIGEFIYGRSYRERSDAVEFDPVELTLSDVVLKTTRLDGFFGAIRDAMPDDWGRRILERRAGRVGIPEFDYLEYGADDRVGALGFGTAVAPPPINNNVNTTSQLVQLQQLADQLDYGSAQIHDPSQLTLQELLLLNTSIGGARPKTQLLHDDELWIAKFSRLDDRWNNPKVEHGLLRLARNCGLTVADSCIEDVGGRDVLLVRRFDRERTATTFFRHRMVSALTILKADERDRHRWSYLSFADEVRRCVASPRKDLKELFLRMCFNAAVSNLDDHPRNHALVAVGSKWQLSPAFDLTAFPVIGHERDLSMNCGLNGRRAFKENLLSGHGRFMLGLQEATILFDHITQIVQTRWQSAMRSVGVSDVDCAIIAPAFVNEGLWFESP